MSSKKKSKKRASPDDAMDGDAMDSHASPGVAGSSDAVASLLGAAQAQADSLDLEAAMSIYEKILASRPDCVAALDGLGEAALQTGDRERAANALTRSIELSPEDGVDRYMNLGQLCGGPEALGWLERGVAMLRAKHAAAAACGEVQAALALASALCSVAEVFLTDACDEPDAEARCEAAASEAVALVQPLSVQSLAEPYVTLASVRLSQERPDEAQSLLQSAVAIFAAANDASPPPFDVRLACAKMLMEVESAADALELLQGLRLEHDDALEVWYLVCCAALQSGEAALARAEATAALAFAHSEVCPPDETEWIPSLTEVHEEASAQCAAERG